MYEDDLGTSAIHLVICFEIQAGDNSVDRSLLEKSSEEVKLQHIQHSQMHECVISVMPAGAWLC